MMRLNIFDLDHTLLVDNSSYRFGFYLYRQNFFSFFTLVACLSDFARHKIFGMNMRQLHFKTFDRLFKGCASDEILWYVDQFLMQNLSSMLNLPVLQRFKAAQERGDVVAIVSSSPDFIVGRIAEKLQVKLWKASSYLLNVQGKFERVENVLEGQDKADYVQALTQQLNIAPSEVTVYSDSYLDLPLLLIAGQAIGVSPDQRLKRHCLKKGWEILDPFRN